MPIEGLPDRKLHRLCLGCRRWFWPEEGVLDWPFATGPVSLLFRRIAVALDDESRMRFFCRPCHEELARKAAKRRRATISTLIACAVMLVAVWAAWAFGVFDGLLPTLHHR